MRELREILARARALRAARVPAATATIVAVEGSSYRREGARMLLEADGGATGVLSGGCVERELAQIAAEVGRGGEARVVVYDLTGDDEAIWGFGLGCSGRVTLLVEPLLGAGGDVLERALSAAIEERRNVLLATVYSSSTPGVVIGERLFVFEAISRRDRNDNNDFIEGKNESRWRFVVREHLESLLPGAARSVRLSGDGESNIEALLESIEPPVQLLVIGAERDVVPLARLGGEMGWDVVVVDPRPTAGAEARFAPGARYVAAAPRDLRGASTPALALDERSAVVVATHRYLDDLAFLGEIANAPIGYLGLLGPTRRRQRLFADLARQGVDLEAGRLRGPAGLALGGRTPEEVALAIVAEIQATLHGGSGTPLGRADVEAESAAGVRSASAGSAAAHAARALRSGS